MVRQRSRWKYVVFGLLTIACVLATAMQIVTLTKHPTGMSLTGR